MSLINFLNKSEVEKNRRRREMKSTFLQLGVLAGAGYTATEIIEKNDVKTAFDKVLKGETPSEFATAGAKIREDVVRLQAAMKEKVEKTINSQALDEEKISKILGDGGNLEDRRALLVSLFESIKTELGSDADLGFPESIEKAYRSDGPIDPGVIDRAKEYYKNNILADEKAKERFHTSHSRTSSVKHLLVKDKIVATAPHEQVGFEPWTRGIPQGKEKRYYTEIQNMFGASRVSLMTQGADPDPSKKSLYAQIDFGSEGKVLHPLHLQTHPMHKNPIFSATESGATLYAGPLKTLNAFELQKAGYASSGGRTPGLVDFVDMAMNELRRGVEQKGSNFSNRDINNYYAWLRTFGTDLPRSTNQAIVRGGVSEHLSENLEVSRAMQSGVIPIFNMDKLDNTNDAKFVSRIIREMPDVFGGPGGQQTEAMRVENVWGGREQLQYQQVQLLEHNGNRTINPLHALQPFGRDSVDRAIQPQTAREQQLVGRPEYLVDNSRGNLNPFGAMGDIPQFGSGRELVGINPEFPGRGANLAMFMVMGDGAAGLGLAEGQAYSGARLKVSTNITKTVSQQGIEGFELMKILTARQQLHQQGTVPDQFIRVGQKMVTNPAQGHYSLDDFFTTFGKGGQAILGLNDADFAVIKQHQGLEEFTLGISGTSTSGGRTKTHFSGEGIKDLRLMKIFSAAHKGTLEPVEETDINARLGSMQLDEQHNIFRQVAPHAVSVFTDESTIKKSPQYLAMQMFGGFRLFGGNADDFEASMRARIDQDKDYKNLINNLVSGQTSELSEIPVVSRQAGFLKAVTESILENTQGMDERQLGMIFGALSHLGNEKRFGLNEQMVADFLPPGVLTEAKKGVAVGAMYATSGDIYTDLGRNLAKTEPRFANYLFTSLRANLGLNAEQATDYVSSIISRQQGVETKAAGALGMQIAQLSLGQMGEQDALRHLQGIEAMDESETGRLLNLVGKETEMSEALSRRSTGNIIEVKNLGLNSKAAKMLTDFLGGKTSFMLPGSDTFEGLRGHLIKSQGKDVDIANEYVRYTNDLIGAITSLRDAGDNDDKLRKAGRGLETSRFHLATVAAATFRSALSGKVLGSGTYRARGIVLGKPPAGGGLVPEGTIANANTKLLQERVFDKTKGLGIFADTQQFMDGFSTFKEGARRGLMAAGSQNVDSEVNDLMTLSLRNFFLGVYKQTPVGFRVDAQRNPLIGLGNIFPDVEMFRGDAYEDTAEFFNKYVRAEYTEVRYEPNAETAKIYAQYHRQAFNDLVQGAHDYDTTRKPLLHAQDALNAKEKELYSALNINEGMNENEKITSRKQHTAFLKRWMGDFGPDRTQGDWKDFNRSKGLTPEENVARRGKYLRNQHLMLEHEILRANDAGTDTTVLKRERDIFEAHLRKFTKRQEIDDIDRLDMESRGVDPGTPRAKFVDSELKLYKTRQGEEEQLHNRGWRKGVIDSLADDQKSILQADEIAEREVKERMRTERTIQQHGTPVPVQRYDSNLEAIEAKAGGTKFNKLEDLVTHRGSIPLAQKADYDYNVDRLLKNMANRFLDTGPQGGGAISFFDIRVASADMMDSDGQRIPNAKPFSGRIDMNKAGVGDFDGDIVQVFYRLNQQAVTAGTRKGVITQGLEMSMMARELRTGMSVLGGRMGSAEMTISEHAVSEFEKEKILKGMGPVDIEMKTAMMGLAQAASESAEPEKAYKRSMVAGMALLTQMEEILVIQSKKLPQATDLPQALISSLRTSFEEGNATSLRNFLETNILKGTDLLEHRQVSLGNIQFENIPGGATADELKKIYGEAKLNLDEIFATLDEAMATVKKHGLHLTTSDFRGAQAFESYQTRTLSQLSKLISASITMEGGFVGGNRSEALSEVGRILDNIEEITARSKVSFASRAGAIGVTAGLVGSYAIGSMMGTGEINPSGNFSDMRVQRTLSTRNLQENMRREHGNVSPHSVGGPGGNFHERPIFSGETTVRSNVSTRFYGEAASMSSGVSMARQFVSAGGQAAMHVNDTRLPISNSYITKSIRD